MPGPRSRPLPDVDVARLVDAPLADLMAEAARLRDEGHGTRMTFSPKVFVPLTMLCRDRCGYCTFAKPPARLDAPFLTIDEVLAIARRGAEMGCREALFTLGEAPEDRYPVAGDWLAAHDHASTVDYLAAACAAVLEETGLLPHANAGALTEADLVRLRAVSPSQGMMLETLSPRLAEPGQAHAGAPDKTPARRLATLEAAGRAGVPFTTGLLVGIGETPRRAARHPGGDPRRARPPRSRAGGDRAELPAQAGHVDGPARCPARPTSSSGPSPPPASCWGRRCTCRRRPT